jgi:hypothetical protein
MSRPAAPSRFSGSTVTTTSVPGGTPTTAAPPSDFPREIIGGFDDHTVSRLRTIDDFNAFARAGVSNQRAVKFNNPSMQTANDVRWMDSNFYTLHDEWYYFRLLNGHAVPGFETSPVQGETFDTVTCSSEELPESVAVEVLTDPLASPDLGFAEMPFVLHLEGESVDRTDCERQELFSTPDHRLFELLRSARDSI